MNPSTTTFASSSRFPIRARTGGIEKAGGLGRDGSGHDAIAVYMPDLGSGTARSSFSMI